MQATLDSLGIEVVDSRGDEINGYCAAHLERTGHVDHNPSWWINADSGAFICFSCNWTGNIYTLIAYTQGVEYEKAKEWLDSTSSLVTRFERITRPPRQPIEETTRVTESMLSAFTNPPASAMASRGLTPMACLEHTVLWNARSAEWVIVLRNPITGQLLGWQEKGSITRSFKNVPAGIKKASALFGYEKYVGGDMIVVESPLDVVRLTSLGISGGVATCGSAVSIEQFNLIRGADRIIFAMDNDSAGRASSYDLLKLCNEWGVECWFFDYSDTDVKDIGGMTKHEIVSGLHSAKHVIHGKRSIT
ncbi:Bacterial DnaG primase, TOPRIM domain [uncultured Caudovirales phage]|uniref:Bacterial DnaG primase, TOPRIM domain n=1 Tax=uncultured Caudovirales phage TaxID=2100421 RepID=A0A6J5QE64_9CAUD|nr:Bacterial DnaG primase, TOPRIM domain [uncultured Caudovirales phage]CAB4179771.1 Bacterial DnaG primase, TOPRIM domain [uncultured Caudovirales phage]CAB4188888.1 Bacterial DnaG primase, TOPRIM domain [uncultured Caudovirales phage]